MPPRLYPCPECHTGSLATPEQKGAIHLDCPCCQAGRVFRDSRGGYECGSCDQRFLIHAPHRNDPYGGPESVGGPLRWWERPRPLWAELALLGACGGLLCLLPVRYWSLLFLALLAGERWFKKK